jgi:hypothetical protein
LSQSSRVIFPLGEQSESNQLQPSATSDERFQKLGFPKMGAVAYRHVADNYIAVFGHFMPPGLWEGIHVIVCIHHMNTTG